MLFFVVTFDTANPEKRPNSQTSAKNTVKKDEYFKQREEEIAQRKKEAEGVCSNSVVCVCVSICFQNGCCTATYHRTYLLWI